MVMNLKTNLEEIEKHKVLLKVEVPSKEVDKAIKSACKEIAEKIRVPGFRPGKIPSKVVKSRVGMETIYNEVVQKMLPVYYRKAVEKEGIDPITQPEVDVVQIEEGKSLKFNATVEVKPEAKLGDYKGVKVTKEKVEIEEEWVDQQLQILQNRFAQLEPVERAAKKGDSVLINFEGKVNGKPFEGGSAEDYLLEIGSNTFIGDFEKQLEGTKKGEIREVFTEFPKGYGNQELAGKKAYFKVLAKEVKQKILPELNDDFAKDVSEFDTLDELRKDIRDKLSGNKEQQIDFNMRMDVLDKVVEGTEIELPETMIKDRKEFKIKDVAASLQKQGISLDDYLKSSNQGREEFEGHAEKEAIEELKREAVLEAVAKLENLEITDEETDNEIKRLAESMNKDPEESTKAAKAQGTYEFFRGNLLSRKAWNWLVDNAKVTEVDKKEKAKAEEKKKDKAVNKKIDSKKDEAPKIDKPEKTEPKKKEKDAEDEENKK
jgi:trigger factor